MDIDKLKQIIAESNTVTETCFKMYGNKLYGNRITIKNYIKQYDINTTHFGINNGNVNSNRFVKTPLSKILVSGSTFNTTNLKEKLYNNGLKERKCELCGQDENWHGKHMSLILDHINGIRDDHRFENLRIVCPNCDATLPTFSGKNVKHKKTEKIKGITHFEQSQLQRKVKRPEYMQLKKEINEFGYLGTGRKYGVSDNAIRKWIKFYEKHNIIV
jgi:hypothetical protein